MMIGLSLTREHIIIMTRHNYNYISKDIQKWLKIIRSQWLEKVEYAPSCNKNYTIPNKNFLLKNH